MGCAATTPMGSGQYTHVIDVNGAFPTAGAACVTPHIVLVAPDSAAWRAVSVANVTVTPTDCLPDDLAQDDNPGGDK